MVNTLEILVKGKGGDQTKREMKKASSAAQSAGKIFKTLGIALSVGVFAKGIQSSIRAYAVQEKAVTKLNAALRIQNDFTEANSKALQDQASALQKVTTFGDEEIISSQALLLSYKLTKEEVKKAIPAILDMAAATGKDLRIATDAVGRAIGGQIPLLKTFGVTVDESAFKTEGMTAVLKALEEQFKGQAKALAKSGIGPTEQFGNLMSDVQENIGRNVIPVLNEMIKTYLNLSKALTKNIDNYQKAWKMIAKGNVTTEEEIRLRTLLEEVDKKGLEAYLLRIEKRLQNEKRVQEQEGLTAEQIEIRILRAIEIEKKRLEETLKMKAEAVETERQEIEETYNFRRELQELDLEGVIDALERELKSVDENEERKKALHLALNKFKREMRVEEAVEIEAMNDRITQLFVDGAKDWGSAWESFRNFVVEFVLRDIASNLVKTIGLGKALKVILGGVTGGGFGFLGGILGFQHGGTVPGPIGQPRAAIVHGGEKWTPPGRAGNEVAGGRIEIHNHFHGLFLEADETKWSRMFREKVYPEMQRMLRKTGEQFSGS